MARIISIHEYALKPDVEAEAFEQAIREAQAQGLFQLPGLEAHHLVKGIRGARCGNYAAIWVYESKEAWETLWGPVGRAHKKSDYPEAWKIWEDQVLAPFLTQDPDRIVFTAYAELSD